MCSQVHNQSNGETSLRISLLYNRITCNGRRKDLILPKCSTIGRAGETQEASQHCTRLEGFNPGVCSMQTHGGLSRPHACARAHTHTWFWYTSIPAHVHTQTCTHTCAHVLTHARTHARTDAYTHLVDFRARAELRAVC